MLKCEKIFIYKVLIEKHGQVDVALWNPLNQYQSVFEDCQMSMECLKMVSDWKYLFWSSTMKRIGEDEKGRERERKWKRKWEWKGEWEVEWERAWEIESCLNKRYIEKR